MTFFKHTTSESLTTSQSLPRTMKIPRTEQCHLRHSTRHVTLENTLHSLYKNHSELGESPGSLEEEESGYKHSHLLTTTACSQQQQRRRQHRSLENTLLSLPSNHSHNFNTFVPDAHESKPHSFMRHQSVQQQEEQQSSHSLEGGPEKQQEQALATSPPKRSRTGTSLRSIRSISRSSSSTRSKRDSDATAPSATVDMKMKGANAISRCWGSVAMSLQNTTQGMRWRRSGYQSL